VTRSLEYVHNTGDAPKLPAGNAKGIGGDAMHIEPACKNVEFLSNVGDPRAIDSERAVVIRNGMAQRERAEAGNFQFYHDFSSNFWGCL
jgi:hypothetical protein